MAATSSSSRRGHVVQHHRRPVVYESSVVAQHLLPPSQHRHIVALDLSDKNHERAWRVRGDLAFEPGSAMVVLPSTRFMASFIDEVQSHCGIEPSAFGGRVNLDSVTAEADDAMNDRCCACPTS